MARAKRTDRTEARRRYRAEQADAVELEGGDEGEYPSGNAAEPTRRKGTAPESSRSAAPAKAAPAPQRPSFTDSARKAYHPARVREDLPYLPKLLVHWSVLVSVGVALAATVLMSTGVAQDPATKQPVWTSSGAFGQLLGNLFIGPPPFGAALLMGFMLPRGTYLVGGLFGIFASLCFTVFLLLQPAELRAGLEPATVLYLWLSNVLGTMFFTSGIAWYRRFLDLLNPARAQRQQAVKKAQAQGRGNAPRNRLSGPTR